MTTVYFALLAIILILWLILLMLHDILLELRQEKQKRS